MWGHAATRFFEVGVCSRTGHHPYKYLVKNFLKISKEKFGNVISSS